MDRVLVTGAGGFVGQAVVKELLKVPGIEVVATCHGKGQELEKLSSAPNYSVIAEVDLTEYKNLERLPGDLTRAIHVAANPRFQGVSKKELFRVNVGSTAHLIRHIHATSGKTFRRFLFTSTIGVHDRAAFSKITSPIRENSPFHPTSSYGQSKLACENYINQSHLPGVIARLSWIYGPAMRSDSHIRVLGEMASRQNWVSKIGWPGRVTAGFIDDVAKAIAGLALKEHLSQSIYFVGHSDPVSFGEIFSLYHQFAGRSVRPYFPASILKSFKWMSRFFPMKIRSLMEDYYVCNVNPLTKENLQLVTPFPDGLRRSVEEGKWFKN